MTDRIDRRLTEARARLEALRANSAAGDLAHALTLRSLQSHVDDLEIQSSLSRMQSTYEMIDLRLVAPTFRVGSVPLGVLSALSSEIRGLFGQAVTRFSEGGLLRKRVPQSIYHQLDLRLAGLLPGSSRLVIAAAANRNLFDEGLAKQALNCVFGVLRSAGKGEGFLGAISELGPSSAKHLREVMRVVRSQSADLHVNWSHGGQLMDSWSGEKTDVDSLTAALELAELKDSRRIMLSGTVELLSKRERINLRLPTGQPVRILFATKLLPQVAALHLDQQVSLDCQLVEMANPLTGETSLSYELIAVVEDK